MHFQKFAFVKPRLFGFKRHKVAFNRRFERGGRTVSAKRFVKGVYKPRVTARMIIRLINKLAYVDCAVGLIEHANGNNIRRFVKFELPFGAVEFHYSAAALRKRRHS